ncbi:hypothetical protein [Nocardia pseudovaccinii]|uniref:hypothetical protein n=1 Tax=Nocardia pseudovaccinii TaxID=189540 RepID=UPI0007A398EE|nr:hypothetical protein [Nocardia pseudovaccinii]
MTAATVLNAAIAVAAMTTACAANTPQPVANDERNCRAVRFAPPFAAVDPCSADAVLTEVVRAVFSYRPSEHADQRVAFRAARTLMDPGFASRAEPAALVWAPVSPTQWQQWRTAATTITASVHMSSDDRPTDTATTASRVLGVDLQPGDQPPIRWAVYANATRTAAAAWALSGIQVLS